MSELPKSVSTGEFTIFGVVVVVHQLDNGQRVIEEESMLALLRALGTTTDRPSEEEMQRFTQFINRR